MNSNQEFTNPDLSDETLVSESRLTCEWKPEYDDDPQFNFDNLIVDELEMPSLESSRELFCEADRFNALYGTHYPQEDLEKFTNYREHYGLTEHNGVTTEEVIEYIQTCHCCNEQLETFAGEYCSGGCHNHVEELGLPCFRGDSCLICNKESMCHCCGTDSWDGPWLSKTFCSDRCLQVGNFHNDKTIPVPDFLQEVTQFNDEFGTAFCQYSFQKLKMYADQMNITAKDAVCYSQQCHCCGKFNEQRTAEQFRPYCSERCRAGIEDYGHDCIHTIKNGDCLICENASLDHPYFIGVPKHPCDDCSSELTHAPFEYYVVDEIYNIESIQCVCNTCFCRNSNYRRRHVRSYPRKNLACHNPLVSTIDCCNELKVYNQVDDLLVWQDLCQYMY
jgi:endogenous inhibitor of DNA gyrase (YacG/DUF329 family)